VSEPIFWLGCSLFLVAVCLTAVLVTAIPALQELARAARSAEKLFDTLYRELPPTLEAIRLTGLEISDLTDDLSDGVESAGNVVKQVDQSFRTAQRQVQDAGITTRSLFAGAQAAWKSLMRPSKRQPSSGRTRDSLARGRAAPEQPTVRYHSHKSDRPANPEPSSEPKPPHSESSPISDAIETFPED
jgi:hypothetical protein